MITIKTAEEIRALREGGKRLARILRLVGEKARPGVSTEELNEFAEKLIRAGGDKPAFLGYQPVGASRPYPATLCVSIDDEVQHGIPNENPRLLEEGQIVDFDCGLVHRGMIVDSGFTMGIGAIDGRSQKLIDITREALAVGIGAARAGSHVGDIGHAIEEFVKPHGYGIVYELCGHGVGYKVHEDPQVPHIGRPGEGEELMSGMVLAIEPMLNEGGAKVRLQEDGYTFETADGSRSAHFEHTIVIADGPAEIITKE